MGTTQVEEHAASIEDQKREREAARESGVAEQFAVKAAIDAIAWPCATICLVRILTDTTANVLHFAAFLLMPTIGAWIMGSLVGWVAHRLFWRRIPVPLTSMAIAMALVVDLMLFGWAQVLLKSDS